MDELRPMRSTGSSSSSSSAYQLAIDDFGKGYSLLTLPPLTSRSTI